MAIPQPREATDNIQPGGNQAHGNDSLQSARDAAFGKPSAQNPFALYSPQSTHGAFKLTDQQSKQNAFALSDQQSTQNPFKLSAQQQATEQQIEKILAKNPHDFGDVFNALESLRQSDPSGIKKSLNAINSELQQHGFLPNLQIIEDNRFGSPSSEHHGASQHDGFAMLSGDKQNPPGNGTMVSTSHRSMHQSNRARNIYRHMHYRHGHYNGWKQSVEGGGGAHGGFDGRAVGGHVPTGARKELIDNALQLAGVSVTPQNEAALNKLVTRESGWNPNITNHWDSNARAGHPSTGLMQTIPSTFHKYALPGLDQNIHDPLSNMVAGLRYIQARYGNRGGLAYVAARNRGY